MENKYNTLQTIFELVKNDPHPTSSVIHPNEIIVRQQYPWDDIIKYLNELKSEKLIDILLHSPAVIFITDAGLQYILSTKTKSRDLNLMYAA